jgi:hypothetical protein
MAWLKKCKYNDFWIYSNNSFQGGFHVKKLNSATIVAKLVIRQTRMFKSLRDSQNTRRWQHVHAIQNELKFGKKK